MLNPKLQIKIKNFYKSKKNFFILFLILFFLLSPFSTSHAAINKQINYQGKLTNASGVAVADGIYNMEFVLYDVSTGGVALWTETRTTTNRVQVTSGLFSVLLGEVTALTSVDFNQTLYLGVNIGGVDLTPVWDGEMTPRKKLGSVPSAVVAENAINIIGGSAGYVPFQTAANTTSFSSNFFWDNSNARLGIGTTSPLQQLQVGTGAGQHVVTIGDARIAIGTNSSSESRIQTGSGKNLTFAVNSDTWNLGTTAMTILTTGNVGIGTTGPAQKLTLIGDARFENNNRNYFKVTTSNGANVVNIGDDMDGGNAYLNINSDTSYSILNSRNIVLGDNEYLNNGITLAIDDTNAKISANSKAGIFEAGDLTGSGNNNILRLTDSVNTLTFTGSVGIGTTAPTVKFDVASNSDANTNIANFLNGGQSTAGRYTWISFGKSLASGGAASFGFVEDTATPANSWAYFGTPYGNSEATKSLIVANSGNVGIGTSTPSTKLEVFSATTPQFKISYDASNNSTLDTDASGYFTLNPSGGITNIGSSTGIDDNELRIYGYTTDNKYLSLTHTGSDALIEVSSGTGWLRLGNESTDLTGGVMLFGNSTSGENREFRVYGYNTATSLSNYGGLKYDDTYDALVVKTDTGHIQIGDAGSTTLTTPTNDDLFISGRMQTLGESYLMGNVGIGTTAPVKMLDIRKASNAPYDAIYGGEGETSYGYMGDEVGLGIYNTDTTDNNYAIIALKAQNSHSTIVTTHSDLVFSSSSSGDGSVERMRINGISGNVGIGTTTPTLGTLQVKQLADTTTGGFTITNNAVNSSSRYYINSTGGAVINSSSTGTGLLTLNEGGGNVGIGTTNPENKLHIASASGSSSNTLFSTNDWISTTTGSGLVVSFGAVSGDTYTKLQAVDVGGNSNNNLALQASGGNVGIGTISPSWLLHISGNTPSFVIDNVGASQVGSIYFRDVLGGGSHRIYSSSGSISMRTGTSGDDDFIITSTGNVGVGTITPGSILNVGSSTTVNPKIRLTGSTTAGSDTYGFTFGFGTQTNDYGGIAMDYSDRATYGLQVFSDASYPISFTTGAISSTPDMFISTAGNVGVGTTAPTVKFDVASNSDANTNIANFLNGGQSTAGRYTWISFGKSLASGGAASFGFVEDTATPANSWAYFGTPYGNSEATKSLIVANSGNVGIGTTSPAQKLTLIGDARFENNNRNYFKVTTSNGANVVNIGDDMDGGNAYLNINSDTSYSILNSRNIVLGDNEYLNNGITLAIDDTNAKISANSKAGIFEAGDLTGSGNNNILRLTDSVNTLTFTGSVGIGTTSPTQKLDVSGNININTNGTSVLLSSYKGADSDGDNIFIGGGGLNSVGVVGATYQGAHNSAIGVGTLNSNTTGYENTALGYYSLYFNTTGTENTAIGVNSLQFNSTGSYNTANGYSSLRFNSTGSYNTANGFYSLMFNTTGDANTASGYASLFSNTTGYNNTALGMFSLYSNTSGIYNTASGYRSLQSSKTGSNGVAIGYESQRYANSTTTAWENTNTSVGYQSLRGSTTASANTGNSNTALGYTSLYSNTTGSENIALGASSLYFNTTGYANTALGYNAGRYLTDGATGRTTGNNGLYLGYNSKASTDGTDNEIAIGYSTVGGGSNSVTLGNDSITKTLLKGNVGIGTTVPNRNLDVGGIIGVENAGVEKVYLYASSTGADVFFTGAGGDVRFDTRSGGISYINTGNVGIGTTAPGALLQVGAGIKLNSDYTINWGGSTAKGYLSWDTGKAIVKSLTGNDLSFGSNGSVDELYIKSGGNVGIGTTSPAQKLTLIGDARFENNNRNYFKVTTSNGANVVNIGDDMDGGNAYLNINSDTSYSILNSRNIVLGDNEYLNNGITLAIDDTNAKISANSKAGIFEAGDLTGSGNNNILRLTDSVNTLTFTGSVGIGTVSPTAVLHLKAGTATASTAPLKFTSGSLLTIPEAGSIEFLTDTYYGTITTGAARKTFAFTEDITTTLGSYLKLDQTTPQTTVGTFTFPKVVGTTDITTPLLIGGSAVDSKLTYKSTTGTGTTSAIAHQWLGGTNGGTVIATMLNNGNVGIGTTAPRDALDFATINGSSDAKNILMGVYNGPTGGGGTTLGGGIVWKANYTGYTKRSAGILQIAEDNYFQAGLAFYTNGSADATTDWSERMRINKAGNVGIGQTAPVAKLGITGNASIGATYGALAAPVSGLIIEGNVGIGTTSPGQKLAVLGAAGDTAVVSISTTSGNTCTFSTTTGSFSCASDIRLKNDVVEILGTDALSKLTEINPVTFHYNWQDENDSLVSGFIAQDFEKVFPEMVSTNSTTGYKSLSYAPLVPYLVQAIQELDIKISNLEKGTIASPADTINDYGEYASLFFSDILVKVENGIAYIKNLVVDTLKIGSPDKRTGITFYDEVNGNPYCFSVSNGTTKTLLGECAVITPPEVIVASGDDTISLPEDINTPITTLNGESVVSLDLGATYNELGALAIDEIEGEIAVVISGDVDTSIAGIYTITYSATNSSGGTSSTTRTVRVGDEDIPIIITNTEPQPEADQPLEEIQESTITETTTVEEITEPTPEPEVDQPSGEVSV